MKFSYEDLLSGDFIFAQGIGHFRSPKLKDLRPTEGVGIKVYNTYLALLTWDKEDFLKCVSQSQATMFEQADKLTLFDMMAILKPEFRELLRCAFDFFLLEKIIWDEKQNCFLTFSEGNEEVGKISRDNFDEVRDMALQMNYMNLGKLAEPKHASAKAKKYWDIEQAKRKEALKASGSNKYMGIGNLISKLCAAPSGYTFHNVYDLTVYQLYDQFFQYSHLRSRELMESVHATHGGDKFDYGEWMKPVPELMKK
jgi:hypothetical protein